MVAGTDGTSATRSIEPRELLADRVRILERMADILAAAPDVEVAGMGFALIGWLREGRGASLEDALGLRPSPGSRSASTVATLRHRDHLLTHAAAQFWPTDSVSAQARQLHVRWLRYSTSGWRADRKADVLPPGRTATPVALFWQILKLRDHVISERSVRAVLAASSPYSLPTEAAKLGPEQEIGP